MNTSKAAFLTKWLEQNVGKPMFDSPDDLTEYGRIVWIELPALIKRLEKAENKLNSITIRPE